MAVSGTTRAAAPASPPPLGDYVRPTCRSTKHSQMYRRRGIEKTTEDMTPN